MEWRRRSLAFREEQAAGKALKPLSEVLDDRPVLDEAIARHAHQLAFVSQPANAQVDFETSRQALIEGYSA